MTDNIYRKSTTDYPHKEIALHGDRMTIEDLMRGWI